MNSFSASPNRRKFLGGSLALGLGLSAFFTTRGAFAEQLARTPRLEEGPFYPPKLPLDTDNDLIVINDSLTPAVGEITHVSGRILGANGEPLRNAVVEIWQCDSKQLYLAQGPGPGRGDANFQGFGRFLTGSTGEYYFRTIKPVPYPGRTPHIHFKVKKGRTELLTTQLFIKDYAQNARDMVFRRLRQASERDLVSSDFKPLEGSKVGELSAHFDIVLGLTPADADEKTRR